MFSMHAIRADITRLGHDAIVNAANSRLSGGGGVDGAIHSAGGPRILEECQAWVRENGLLATGSAMVTGAGDLPARHVIHTVGPVYTDNEDDEGARLLADCYRNSLRLASSLDCESIAFPCISTGVYGYPKLDAARIAIDAVRASVGEGNGVDHVTFVTHDPESQAIYDRLLDA